MSPDNDNHRRAAWWVYGLALAIALPSTWIFKNLANLFDWAGTGEFSGWLGALSAGGLLAALAFWFAWRWPRHGPLWGLLLVWPTLLATVLWLGINWAQVDLALRLEVAGTVLLLGGLTMLGGRWGQQRTYPEKPAATQLAGHLRIQASRAGAALGALGGLVRAWAPGIGLAHLAFNLVALAIIGLALIMGALFGEFAGALTGFFLGAPQFLLFFFLAQRVLARLFPGGYGQGGSLQRVDGYLFSLGFAVLWLGIVGSMQALEIWRLQHAEVVEDVRLEALPALAGRNLWLGAEHLVPARVDKVRSYGFSEQVKGANRTHTTHFSRVYVVPLVERWQAAQADAVRLDTACVWLGARHRDASSASGDATKALMDHLRRQYAQRLLETEPRWLREVIWPDVAARWDNTHYAVTGHDGDSARRYRRAIRGLSDAERGCRPVVFQAVDDPMTARAESWRLLGLYFLLSNLIPLLLLFAYGLVQWHRSRPTERPISR